jgi:hypothetical protein
MFRFCILVIYMHCPLCWWPCPSESEAVAPAAGVQRQSNLVSASCYSDLKQQAGPGVSDFKFASRHFLPLHHPAAAHVRQCCFEKFLPLIEVWFHVSISHWVSLFHIFTLNPVGIPAMCSVGIPAVSMLFYSQSSLSWNTSLLHSKVSI